MTTSRFNALVPENTRFVAAFVIVAVACVASLVVQFFHGPFSWTAAGKPLLLQIPAYIGAGLFFAAMFQIFTLLDHCLHHSIAKWEKLLWISAFVVVFPVGPFLYWYFVYRDPSWAQRTLTKP